MGQVDPIPKGMHTLTPNLILRDCAGAIEFYKRALGAQEVMRFPSPDGKAIWHAELRIGDSIFYMSDEMPGMGTPAPTAGNPAPVNLWLHVADCDAAFRRATDAGGKATMPPGDMFWGDRCATFDDPFGYRWSFSTHQKDMTAEELRRGGEEFARTMREQHGQPGR